MVNYYDEIEIEDMTWDEVKQVYHYPCPCGDRFEITRPQLAEGYDVGQCPSCSLLIRIIFDQMDFEEYAENNDEPEEEIKAEKVDTSTTTASVAVAA
ncbi:zf-CSL-domain-containing protein [Cystobasidium minutum MCA 4210]|uniref:zf-CSL-domain-containing protein n=1 Tax=Cystobasidium minutum MCA 4210 TaxID=1397322 RepID=UPI0034CEB686|eukprot:jgi/Rhomi1/192443/gm1.657_g